jgi:multidrug efflux system membrane fusion protein
VKDDKTVEMRPVTVARTVDRWAVIEKGVQPGEMVVTDGQLRLVPGAKVEIKNSNPGEERKPEAKAETKK